MPSPTSACQLRTASFEPNAIQNPIASRPSSPRSSCLQCLIKTSRALLAPFRLSTPRPTQIPLTRFSPHPLSDRSFPLRPIPLRAITFSRPSRAHRRSVPVSTTLISASLQTLRDIPNLPCLSRFQPLRQPLSNQAKPVTPSNPLPASPMLLSSTPNLTPGISLAPLAKDHHALTPSIVQSQTINPCQKSLSP